MASRQLDDLSRIGILLDLEGGTARGDACGFGLVAAGDDASVIVGEDNNFFPVEPRVKHPLTGNKEIIAVN